MTVASQAAPTDMAPKRRRVDRIRDAGLRISLVVSAIAVALVIASAFGLNGVWLTAGVILTLIVAVAVAGYLLD
jgi:predicted permease